MTLTTEVGHQTKKIHVNSHKTDIVDQIDKILSIEIIIHDQTQIDEFIHLIINLILNLVIDTIEMIDQETHRTIDIEIIPTVEKEATQIIKTNDIKTIDHELIQTTDQITKDLNTTTIKIDHEIIHKIGV